MRFIVVDWDSVVKYDDRDNRQGICSYFMIQKLPLFLYLNSYSYDGMCYISKYQLIGREWHLVRALRKAVASDCYKKLNVIQ